MSSPAEWSDAFERLADHTPPCPGFRGDEWRAVHAASTDFLANGAQRAYALGWTGLDLFGVHEKVGATRVDACGALMVCGGVKVTAIERDVITLGNRRFFKIPSSERVLAWRWGKV